jgi:hypothetical protein
MLTRVKCANLCDIPIALTDDPCLFEVMVQAKRFGACGAASPHYVTIDFMNDNVKVAVPEYLVLI